MTLPTTSDQSMRDRRPYHASRSAESHAAFLLPHLRPGMSLLDMGCGPGSITVGLAAAVAPGTATGLDIDPQPVDGVEVVSGDVMAMPFPDARFDAVYMSAVLQHLPEPLGALREARRVARPGAVIGVVDADWDGELIYPFDDVLRESMALARRLREGTSPYVGRRLRHLLTEAGFDRVEASARVIHHGTPDETRGFGAFTGSLFRQPGVVNRAVNQGWATEADLEGMSEAWAAWGRHPGAFVARFWCEAVGWAD
jgi:SAM-dependent methyltransferase